MYAGSSFEITMLLLQAVAFIVGIWVWLFIRDGMENREWLLFLFLLIVPYYSLIIFVFWRAKMPFLSWILFLEDHLVIYTLFCKKRTMLYSEIKGCGIGSYDHGTFIGLSQKRFFVFLSEKELDDDYRTHINRWIPKKSRYVKIAINKKRYESIVGYLPQKLADLIQCDYKKNGCSDCWKKKF